MGMKETKYKKEAEAGGETKEEALKGDRGDRQRGTENETLHRAEGKKQEEETGGDRKNDGDTEGDTEGSRRRLLRYQQETGEKKTKEMFYLKENVKR